MDTLPRGSRNENQNEYNDKLSAGQISAFFHWDETQSTGEVDRFLRLKTKETALLSLNELNKLFQKHNGKKYSITDEIGSGGFGNVYSILDDDNSGLCVKVIDLFYESIRDKGTPKNITNRELMTQSSFLTRLKFAEREYSINTKLYENHAYNCVEFIPEISFVDHSIRPYLTFLVMKKMDGNIRNRPQQLKSNVTNRTLALTVMTDILRALDTIDILDITSRDVNPGNIMYKYEDESTVHFYLGDFGIGTINSNSFTVTDTYSVYRDHITPASQRDIRSDIYSLALVAAYIDQGFPKDENGNPENMHSCLDQKRKKPEENDPFYKILCKATEPKIDLRYSSPDEIRTDILRRMTDTRNSENALVSLEILKDFMNEQHEKETEKLREQFQAQLLESDDLINDLNEKNSNQMAMINDLKSQLDSAGEKADALKEELNKKEKVISALNANNANLMKKNHDLEDEKIRYAEMAESAPDKLWLPSKVLWIAAGLLFASGVLFNLIMSVEILSMIHYLFSVTAACIYIWMLYAKRVSVTHAIDGYSRIHGESLSAKELKRIRMLTILCILATLPAINIIRWFTQIRDRSITVKFGFFEKFLKLSFNSSSMCIYLSVCFILGIVLFSTYYFAFSKKRMYSMKDVIICVFSLFIITVLFETGMYYLAGYNTLGFSIATNEPVIYWHDPSNSLSRTSKISNSSSAIKLHNNGVVNVSYDSENNTLVFTDSYIVKPLYFSGNINLKISGKCTFENTTDQNAANITVYNGYLTIDKMPDSKLEFKNNNGVNIKTDRYLWISNDDDFEVSAYCNSNDACIYAGYGTTTNSYSINAKNSGSGSLIMHGFENVISKPAKNVTIMKSATGATETIPISEINNASQYITGVKYDSENKTLILNNAEITAPISFDGYIELSVNGKCSFTNPENLPDSLIKSEGYVELTFAENSDFSMVNHAGADIISNEYIFCHGNIGDVKPKYICNTSEACLYTGYSTNINYKIAELKNENNDGRVFYLGYK